MIKFKVKRLTTTATLPKQENAGDLYDLFADDFCQNYIPCVKTKTKAILSKEDCSCELLSGARILVKTGIAIELPIKYDATERGGEEFWSFDNHSIPMALHGAITIKSYAVADIRPRSGLALKHGITVLNTPGTIDNSYRKEIGIILINNGHEPYTIEKGDKIAQMLIRELEPSEFEEVKGFSGDDIRGGFGSSGKK